MLVELWHITPDAERLIERIAKTSRASQPGKTLDETRAFIRKLIKLGHESPLEHASATFFIGGISRACSHQLVRHRLASFIQESQRFMLVRNEYVLPDSIAESELGKEYEELLEKAHQVYLRLIQEGIPLEDARYILPQGFTTSLVLTANFRELRHIIRLRAAQDAQWEIRTVAKLMLATLLEQAPSCFEDLAHLLSP